jgi:hypothetical protein
LVSLLVLEGVLRLLPVENGLFGADADPNWPAHHMVPNSHFTSSATWTFENVRRGSTNNMGFVAPFDYRPGASGIAVIGDSFVEATMNAYRDTMQAQLSHLLRNAPAVLNFGVSGAALPDYVGVAPMVMRVFHPDWLVILVVAGDFSDGFNPSPGYFGWDKDAVPPVHFRPEASRGPVAKFIRSLALVRYTRANLRASVNHLLHSSANGSAGSGRCTAERLQAGDSEFVESWARSLPGAYGLSASQVVLVFDSDRATLYRNKARSEASSCATRDGLARIALAGAARALGEHVVDMAPVFAAFYRATGDQVDYMPSDGHWNAVGHRLAAIEVANVINAGAVELP